MSWLLPHVDPTSAQRRLDAAVSGALDASRETARAARDLRASTDRTRESARQIEEGSRRRIQAQETRRQARATTAAEGRMMDYFERLRAETGRVKRGST
ncbi:hypothetical protein E4V01_20475 [Methylorubrum sp. Q1]|uniref:hypothetical protein n=1 Tax=Methylorubrum sp. Q1 TaxID=2562453 RepID=UPI001076B502|nr:hypothetical protein [Methylorubrum sp. Q1]TFZ55896.1 hypothetical protein E4V01_20475 [Methylorubrum sp. Q1]